MLPDPSVLPIVVQSASSIIAEGDHLMILLAYLDPGSGSILLQLLLAGMLSMGYFVRSNLLSIKAFFKRTDEKYA
jgi:hypothetical protein